MDEATRFTTIEEIRETVSRTFDGSLGESACLIMTSVTDNGEEQKASTAMYNCSLARVESAVKSVTAAFASDLVRSIYAEKADDAATLVKLALKIVEVSLMRSVTEGLEVAGGQHEKEEAEDGRSDEA